jgi:hypothetical protein
MVVDELTDTLMKRRAELVNILENRNENIGLEKQHQIYGAINEIDIFLHTMSFYEKNSTRKDLEPINLVKPVESKGIFENLFEGIKSKVKKNK